MGVIASVSQCQSSAKRGGGDRLRLLSNSRQLERGCRIIPLFVMPPKNLVHCRIESTVARLAVRFL
jgi:hypothetical protein